MLGKHNSFFLKLNCTPHNCPFEYLLFSTVKHRIKKKGSNDNQTNSIVAFRGHDMLKAGPFTWPTEPTRVAGLRDNACGEL